MTPSQNSTRSASAGTNIAAAISPPRSQLWPRWRIHNTIGSVMLNAIASELTATCR